MSNLEYFLELPFAPTVNNYYSKTQSGIYISKRGRTFREDVANACREQNLYGKRLDFRMEMHLILYAPDARQRDLDNYVKATQDALTQANVWVDDALIDELRVLRGVKVAGGAMYIRIREHHGFILPHNADVWSFVE